MVDGHAAKGLAETRDPYAASMRAVQLCTRLEIARTWTTRDPRYIIDSWQVLTRCVWGLDCLKKVNGENGNDSAFMKSADVGDRWVAAACSSPTS